jgi:hypothetical protein
MLSKEEGMRASTEKGKGKKTVNTTIEGVKMLAVVSPVSQSNPTTNSECKNCGRENTKCRRRSFSYQAWTVLLLWNEISPSAVDQPICEHCYEEMRDILIDRANEIDAAMEQREEVEKIRRKLGSLAS